MQPSRSRWLSVNGDRSAAGVSPTPACGHTPAPPVPGWISFRLIGLTLPGRCAWIVASPRLVRAAATR